MRTLILMLPLCFPALPRAATHADIDSGLVAHWTFDETAGALAADATPTAADAHFSGDYAWTEGPQAGAIELGPNGGGATLDMPSAFDITTFSIACWFRCENADSFRVITSRNTQWQDRQWWVTVWQEGYSGNPSGALVFRMSPVSGTYVNLSSTERVDDNQWHSAIVTVDSDLGEARLYLDGQLVDSAAGFTAPKLPSADAVISGDESNGGREFLGAIDDLRIYDRVLTEEEREALSTESRRTRVVQWREIGTDEDR